MGENDRRTVAVDLDGVLAEYDGWEGLDAIGDPVEGAEAFLEALSERFEVVIYTTRLNPNPFDEDTPRTSLERCKQIVVGWLERHDLPYDDVFVGTGKPIAVAYVDDRAVTCKPQQGAPLAEFRAALVHVAALAEG